MVRVFLTALFALAPSPGAASADDPIDLDRRCYRLMAELAAADDPQVHAAGLVGAQYFLGRLDVETSGETDPRTAPPAGAEQQAELLRRCSDLMGAQGRDFRALGERLARSRDAV